MKSIKQNPLDYLIPVSIVLIAIYFLLTNLLIKEVAVVKVGLKWLHQSQFAGYYLAEREGYYNQNGLQVNLIERDAEQSAIEQVATGKLQFAIVSSTDLLNAIDANKPIIAVFALYQKSPGVIVSLKEKNITSPKNFEGKNLGVVSDTVESRIFYTSIAKTRNIDPKNLHFTSTGFNQVEFLLNKKVDAVSTYRIAGLQALENESKNLNIIYPEDYGYTPYDDILITNTNFLENNRETVRKFVKASADGWNFALRHPEIALNTTLHYLPTNSNKDFQKNMFSQSIPLIETSNDEPLGIMSNERWKAQIQSLYEEGLIKKINPNTVFTNKYLE